MTVSNSSATVLVSCNQAVADQSVVSNLLKEVGLVGRFVGSPQSLSAEEIIRSAEGCLGVIAGDEQWSREVIEALPDLQAIARWGIGVDNVDFDAADDCSVVVTNTPGVFADTVAEAALGYLIGLTRGLFYIDREAQQGRWTKYRGKSLSELQVGVVGLGSIGSEFVSMAKPLVKGVTAFDPNVEFGTQIAKRLDIAVSNLEQLLEEADAVVICAALSPDTHHLIGGSMADRIKRGSILVNVGRGPIVDEEKLELLLDSGQISACALDVFEQEPLPQSSRLRGRSNVVIGSHNGSNAEGACLRTHEMAVRNLAASLSVPSREADR